MCNNLKQKLPPYSVLMSVYCKESPEFLQQSINSMLNQTVKPSEIIVVEDGPLTSDLYGVLDNYSEEYGDLFIRVKNEQNLGLGRALNGGLLVCNNELIARMDTDDISKLDRCEKQLQMFVKNPELDVVGGQINEFIGEPNNTIGHRNVPLSHEDICKFIKKRNPFTHPTVMFKKSSVISAGNYIELHYNEDYYLWARMLLNGARFANIDDVVLDMRVSNELYARRGGYKYYKCQKAMFKFLRKNKLITYGEYLRAKTVRFIAQVLMPNWLRAWSYKKFIREKK